MGFVETVLAVVPAQYNEVWQGLSDTSWLPHPLKSRHSTRGGRIHHLALHPHFGGPVVRPHSQIEPGGGCGSGERAWDPSGSLERGHRELLAHGHQRGSWKPYVTVTCFRDKGQQTGGDRGG